MNTSTAARLLAVGIAIASGFASIAGPFPSVTPPAPTIPPTSSTPSTPVPLQDLQIKELRFVPGPSGSVFSGVTGGERSIKMNLVLKAAAAVSISPFRVLATCTMAGTSTGLQTSVMVGGMTGNSELNVPLEIRVPDPVLGNNVFGLVIIADSNRQVSELTRTNNTAYSSLTVGRDYKGPYIDFKEGEAGGLYFEYTDLHPVSAVMKTKKRVR